MNFINNLKIREKLSLLFLVLLVPLLLFVINSTITEFSERNELFEARTNLAESRIITNLLHEFQIERGLTGGYITSEGKVYLVRMRAQRSLTDEAISNLQNFMTDNNQMIEIMPLFFDFPFYRKQIDDLAVDLKDWDLYYFTIRDSLLKRIGENANKINIRRIRDQLNAHSRLTNAKQYLGLIRTLTNQEFLRGGFDYLTFGQLNTYYYLYQMSIDGFNVNASDTVLSSYRAVIQKESFREAINLLDRLARDPELNSSDYNPIEWFEKLTSAIDDLRNVEIHSNMYLESLVDEQIRNKDATLLTYFLGVFIAIIIAFSLAIYIIRFITHSVLVLKSASDKLSLGLPVVEAPIYSKDEFGELADSFRKMAEKNNQLSLVAEAVGKGDYEVGVDVKGPQDVLGNALKTMKDNLKTLSIENESRSWTLYGISRLNDLMGSVSGIGPTSKIIIDHLCQYLKCDLGVIFINKDSRFVFAAGYGTEEHSFKPTTFSLGEGVSGEAILQRQIMIIDEIPEQDLKIRTALSETAPKQIMVCPFYFNDRPIGAIELCSRNPFDKQDEIFVTEAAERVGVAINAIQTNLKTQELLYQTQNQTEELEAQQEELRQMNEELKTQKDQLQMSEEELKVSQEELQEKNRELEKKASELGEQNERIQIKNKELENARQAIELKVMQVESISRYKTEFLANMSHELRTPLNSILILSKLLVDEAEKSGLQKSAEHAQVINSSGHDLLKLINDILDLSKIESGQIRLELKEVPMKSLNLMADFKPVATEKNIEFNMLIDPDAPEILVTDEFRLRQVLKNLLSNAFKFTPKNGKIEYRIFSYSGERNFVREALKKADSIIGISIKDTGIGIPKEKQKLIFEAFQQADSSTTRKYGGTGLGLSISRELATLLGGEIHLESTVNKGSVFTLYLPQKNVESESKATAKFNIPVPALEPLEAVSQVAALSDGKPSKKKKTVLVVDDDRGFNKIVSDFAKSQGLDVLQAFSGSQTLEMLKKQPDAVLLDVHLPDMDGLDILKMIKEDPRLANTQVHLMTAYDEKVKDRDAEFEGYLPKPVTLEQIGKAFTAISHDPIRKVLIVEDNEKENHAIVELLASEQIRSVSAFSGKEALQLLDRDTGETDAVILDLMLPDMDGFKVMEEIRSRKTMAHLSIIVYSGKDLNEQEEKKLKKYANTIIIKNEYSYLRLLDEVKLFLRKMGEKLGVKRQPKVDLHLPEGVLKDQKALIVDDDVRNIYSLYNALENQGMDVLVANDGKEALNRIEDNDDIDIVLMDIMMPEMDGIECIKRIRQMNRYKELPIIALTAKAMKGDKEKCIEAGASDYVSKPVDMQKLISLMRVWIYDRRIKS